MTNATYEFKPRRIESEKSPNRTLPEAQQLMLEHKISGLRAIDRAGHVVGIITESDIFRLVVCEWSETASVPMNSFS